MRRIIFFVVFIIAIAGGIYVFPLAMKYYRANQSSLILSSSEEKKFFIPSESSTETVIELLVTAGIIKASEEKLFLEFALSKNYKKEKIIPGRYTISGSMSNNDLVNHLRFGNGREEVKVTFNNVRLFPELAGKVARSIEADSIQLLALFNDPDVRHKYGFQLETFSAMFIPNTYRMDWATSAEEFVARMAEEFKKFWTPERTKLSNELNLSQSEVATLASIVQEEQSVKIDEKPIIAGLYLNRIRKQMRLESDPTLKFCWKEFDLRRVLNKHKEIESPYNTYKHAGLPPGPITFPNQSSLDAVLYYKKHDYIFMVAKPEYSGYHNFSKTYNQHLRYARVYWDWLRSERVK